MCFSCHMSERSLQIYERGREQYERGRGCGITRDKMLYHFTLFLPSLMHTTGIERTWTVTQSTIKKNKCQSHTHLCPKTVQILLLWVGPFWAPHSKARYVLAASLSHIYFNVLQQAFQVLLLLLIKLPPHPGQTTQHRINICVTSYWGEKCTSFNGYCNSISHRHIRYQLIIFSPFEC